jgi:hypothetical protein
MATVVSRFILRSFSFNEIREPSDTPGAKEVHKMKCYSVTIGPKQRISRGAKAEFKKNNITRQQALAAIPCHRILLVTSLDQFVDPI